jgi:hypothetical protein
MTDEFIMNGQDFEPTVSSPTCTALLCGDKVTYPRCFGDKELIFVGMATQLKFSNDCVITYDGDCTPATYSGLKRVAS